MPGPAQIPELSFQGVVEGAPTAIVAADANGRIVMLNAQAERLFGYARDGLMGQPIEILVPERFRSRHAGFFQRFAMDPSARPMGANRDLYGVRQDGSEVPVEIGLNPIWSSGHLYILASIVDISDRRRREDEQHRSERRLSLVVEATGAGVWEWDPATGLVWCSDHLLRLLGLRREDFGGTFHDLVRLVHPDDRERFTAAFTSHLKHGTACEVDLRIQRDGAVHAHCRALGMAERTPTGEVKRMVGSLVDVTGRMRGERMLHQTSQAAHVGGWELDCLSGTLFWTPEVYRIHDLDPGQYTPTLASAITYYADEARIAITEAVKRAMATGDGYDLELPLISATGRRLRVRVIANTERDRGRTIRVFGSIQDVTAHHDLEERFRQAQKMEAVGRLAGGIAHDFNNLLSVISGHVELALMKPEKVDALRARLDAVMQAVDSAKQLTRQILAFSRKQRLSVRRVDLAAEIARFEQMVARLIGEDIEFGIDLQDGLWPVQADPAQLHQVLMNLVVNARDAMPKGGRLRISAGNRPAAADHLASDAVVLTVSDSGCGMGPDVLRHLFEPFFTTKERGRGTGLGLATVYGIIQQHGGQIRVDSTVGSGTTFTIHLPRSEAGSESRQTVMPRGNPGGRERILVVEDQEQLRNLAAEMLRSHGYEVLVAADGRAAMHLAEQAGQIDLLLSDVIMPGMTGYELHGRLITTRPDLPVLFMSGYTERAGDQLSEDTARLLHKPFTIADLTAAVRVVLDEAAQRKQ